MDNCIIEFDGACEPVNPGGIAAWGYIVCHNGAVIAQECGIVGSGPGMTNNVAEYTACIEAVKRAKALGYRSMHIQGDSQLVIRQMDGEYEVRSDRILPLYNQLCDLVSDLDITFKWIPREQNGDADALSRQAYREIAEEDRRQRAREIPDGNVSQIDENQFEVVGSRGICYRVDIASETCTCQDFQKHRSDRIPIRCKHILKIGFFTQRAQVNDDQHARKY